MEPVEGQQTLESGTPDNQGDAAGQQQIESGQTPQGTTPDSGEGAGEIQPKAAYTPEEVKELLTTGAEIDTDRLSDEGKLLMRSFQAGLTPKLQEIAETRRQMAAEWQRMQEASRPPQNIEEALVRDPQGVMQAVRLSIAQAQQRADQAAEIGDTVEAIKAQNEVLKYQAYGRDLEHTYANLQAAEQQRQETWKSAVTFLEQNEKITNEKVPQLREFAVRNMGMHPDEVQQVINELSDPRTAPRAVRFIQAVNRNFDVVNAGRLANNRIVAASPPPIGGSGGGAPSGTTTPKKESINEWMAKRNKEKHGGK